MIRDDGNCHLPMIKLTYCMCTQFVNKYFMSQQVEMINDCIHAQLIKP